MAQLSFAAVTRELKCLFEKSAAIRAIALLYTGRAEDIDKVGQLRSGRAVEGDCILEGAAAQHFRVRRSLPGFQIESGEIQKNNRQIASRIPILFGQAYAPLVSPLRLSEVALHLEIYTDLVPREGRSRMRLGEFLHHLRREAANGGMIAREGELPHLLDEVGETVRRGGGKHEGKQQDEDGDEHDSDFSLDWAIVHLALAQRTGRLAHFSRVAAAQAAPDVPSG